MDQRRPGAHEMKRFRVEGGPGEPPSRCLGARV